MKEFTVLIEKDEDGWLVGKVVELPGCQTQAKGVDELMKRIKEAIEGYLDVKEDIPTEKIEFIGIQKVAL
ncbi:type II toxin-antitoxin system HicB family antitoxin [Mesoaciditoga lauensis]|uniref:type II toxin-antitoxin system HicB family antitoxin n=1 Tax=Mesoaciditoga lauensis TaxID=1495039 RepID=UPI000568A819|nr:type II toxin-antitoxin system HicB family antitoxin [Mesoaciditoga lauensis]